jgi:hypothetical protein
VRELPRVRQQAVLAEASGDVDDAVMMLAV